MSLLPQDFTKVIKNNIPFDLPGINYAPLFGMALTSARGRKGMTIFQPQLFLRIIRKDTKEVLFEFRTATSISFKKSNNEAELLKHSYDFLLTAISGFNWYLKANKSKLTLNKTYSPIPTFEQSINPIGAAYMGNDLGSGVGMN